MSNKVDLRLDWCSYEAAKYAVEHWHYSKVMPYGSSVKIGVWENSQFIGCVVFSHGATPNIGKPYGLSQFQICELTRIAMSLHLTPITKILSLSIKMLKRQSPSIKLIVSFADSEQNHLGIVYQAANFVYTGATSSSRVGFIVNGKKKHTRSIGAMGGTQSLEWVRNNLDKDASLWVGEKKYRYLYPLDDAMRKQIEPLRKPYPKRGLGEIDNAPETNRETGGASLTSPLLPVIQAEQDA